jgi:hypothetical protein
MIDEHIKLELSEFEKHIEEIETYAIDVSKEIEKTLKEPEVLFTQIYEDSDQEVVLVYNEEIRRIFNNICEKYKEMGGLVDCLINLKQRIDEPYYESLYKRTKTVESFLPAMIRHLLEHLLWVTKLMTEKIINDLKQSQEILSDMQKVLKNGS